jgi:hypothetical protein
MLNFLATSLLETAGRVATKGGIIARIRPQPYYRPSECTYSRLFAELREAIDMVSVKLQKVVFVENLRGTGIVCLFRLMKPRVKIDSN